MVWQPQQNSFMQARENNTHKKWYTKRKMKKRIETYFGMLIFGTTSWALDGRRWFKISTITSSNISKRGTEMQCQYNKQLKSQKRTNAMLALEEALLSDDTKEERKRRNGEEGRPLWLVFTDWMRRNGKKAEQANIKYHNSNKKSPEQASIRYHNSRTRNLDSCRGTHNFPLHMIWKKELNSLVNPDHLVWITSLNFKLLSF